MQTIKKMIKNIMEECTRDNPSWMAIRSWCMEILRLLDHLEK